MATNPYLASQASAITSNVTDNLRRNILPGIGGGAAAVGGYGGSRQAILEANAIGQTNQGLSGALAGLYGNAYAQDQQNDLTRTGMANQFALGNRSLDLQGTAQQNQYALGNRGLDLQGQGQTNQYNLGLGGLALQNRSLGNQFALGNRGLDLQGQNQMQNFYTQQRGLDQSGARLGAELYGQGNAGMVGQGVGLQGIGNTQQQAPWWALQNAGGMYGQFSGLGGSTSQTQQGSRLGGALGGALGGYQFGRNLGFGGGGYGSPAGVDEWWMG